MQMGKEEKNNENKKMAKVPEHACIGINLYKYLNSPTRQTPIVHSSAPNFYAGKSTPNSRGGGTALKRFDWL